MSITPTAGIASAWSAVKTSPNERAAQPPLSRPAKAATTSEEAAQSMKGPPAPEGQGTRVDIRA